MCVCVFLLLSFFDFFSVSFHVLFPSFFCLFTFCCCFSNCFFFIFPFLFHLFLFWEGGAQSAFTSYRLPKSKFHDRKRIPNQTSFGPFFVSRFLLLFFFSVFLSDNFHFLFSSQINRSVCSFVCVIWAYISFHFPTYFHFRFFLRESAKRGTRQRSTKPKGHGRPRSRQGPLPEVSISTRVRTVWSTMSLTPSTATRSVNQ